MRYRKGRRWDAARNFVLKTSGRPTVQNIDVIQATAAERQGPAGPRAVPKSAEATPGRDAREVRSAGDRIHQTPGFVARIMDFRTLIPDIVQSKVFSTSDPRVSLQSSITTPQGLSHEPDSKAFSSVPPACRWPLPLARRLALLWPRAGREAKPNRRRICPLHAPCVAPTPMSSQKTGRLRAHAHLSSQGYSAATTLSSPDCRMPGGARVRPPGIASFLTGGRAGRPAFATRSPWINSAPSTSSADALPQPVLFGRGCRASWTEPAPRTGVRSPSLVFAKLFLDGRTDEVKAV